MANIAIFRINYKSDFILTLNSDAGWMTPFCIKFWTSAPSQAYFAGYDGTTYTHCAPVDGEPTKLRVQFDDHHLPIGDLKFQIGYHFTVADFPNDTEDEVLNQANITTEIDGEDYQVMLDFIGETAPEIQFSLPAYANEAQRIANEQQRIANEDARIQAEETRQQNEQQRIDQETARVNEFARLKRESEQATTDANAAAILANEKAQLAADKAALAQAAATLAGEKAQLAADKAALANAAAQLANEKAALAQQKAEYAQQQGSYAKDQGDYAKNQGNYAKEQGEIAQADHERAESDHGVAVDDHTQAGNDHTRAESDHGIAANDHTQAGNDHTRAESDHGIAADDHTQAGNDHTRAESDHGIAADDHTQAGNDHTRAESDHTRAESDHAAVEMYVDSLGVFDISAYHATGGVLAKYADLTAALGTNGANIPEALRKGGMSVKFVQSSDKYVQARCMAQNFTTDVTQWQVVAKEIKPGGENLVDSSTIDEGFQRSLKSIYSKFRAITAISTETGGYLTPSGSVTITGGNTTTLKFDVEGLDIVSISGRQGNPVTTYALACAYDTNDQLLKAFVFESGTSYNDYYLTLPAGAKYLKVCTSNTTIQPTVNCYSLKGLKDLEERVDDIEERLTTISELTPTETVEKNLLPDGTWGTASGNCYTNKYDVEGFLNAYITGRQGSPITDYALACAYDSDNELLQAFIGEVGTNYTDYKITLPTDTKYLRVCTSNRIYQPNVACKVLKDLEERVDDIEERLNSDIPSYWQSYIDEKVDTINVKNYGIGLYGDNFVFITDVHLDYNFGNSPKLIKYILDKTSVKNVVFGGDTYTSASSTAKAEKYLQNLRNSFNNVNYLLAIRGNHDTGNSLTKGNFYSIFDRPLENNIDTLDHEVYFYKDNVNQNIRYIFCDITNLDSAIGAMQSQWITDRITELEAGWKVVLFAHSYWQAVAIGSTVTVTTAGSSLKSIIDNAVDNANAKVIALITGHTHADRDTVSEKGYVIVSTTCDGNGSMASTYDPVTPIRTAGTTSEQVFDVFNIDTSNKKIYITRIGGNGQDRELTYQ